jgi:hypothetical protein
VIARRCQRQRDAVHDRHADVGEQQLEGAALARQQIERLGPSFAVVTAWPSITSARRRNLRSASSSSAIRIRASGPHSIPQSIPSLNPGDAVAAIEEAHQHVVASGGGEASRERNGSVSPGASTLRLGNAVQA